MRLNHTNVFKRLFFLLIPAFFVMASCQQGSTKTEKPVMDTTAMEKDTTQVFDHLLVDNKKDPSCGMPLTAGIGDTAHYKGKVLGFCSKECKEAFEKNPESMLAAAEIKK
jgi:YHS domain-containing protein